MPASGFGSSNLKSTKNATGGRLATILCVLSIVLFTLSCREAGSGPLTMIRGGFSVVASPVRAIGSLVGVPFQGLGNVVSNLTADQETLTELKEENAKLKAANAEYAENDLSVSRLQELLDLQDTYSLQSTAARIISGSTDSWSSTVTIDKGSTSGLTVGMPVCSSTGVIGQIMECGPTSSVVRLMSDEDSRISAMVQTTRASGTLAGSADGTLKLTGISVDQKVEVGDIIITSGLGGVYPKGLPLGTVTSCEKPTGALYWDIVVESIATTESQEEVLIITSLTEAQKKASASDDTSDTAGSSADDTQSTSE